jgi:hypothetical protein
MRLHNQNKPTSRVAVVGGSWSSNIGNAFYNIGSDWLLRQCHDEVFFVPESPRWKEKVPTNFPLVGSLECDLVILVGPCLNLKLGHVYRDSFCQLYERGVKVGYLSAGMSLYDEGEAAAVGKFFKEFPPAFIATRDHLTYRLVAPHVSCPIHSGICTSMFLNDSFTPVPLSTDPYIVLNFDHTEPSLQIDQNGIARMLPRRTFFGWDRTRVADKINGITVVRTSNLSIDEGYRKIFSRPNTYHSDLPWGYCAILKHATFVYSERVHTCAAALIYGGKAQFVAKSDRSFEKRSLLFEKIGLGEIFSRPVQIDFDVLNPLKKKLIEFVQEVIS